MNRLPSFDPDDLRDHADPERVERIWARVSNTLDGAPPGVLAVAARPRRTSASRATLLFAAAFALFGGGLFVGHALDLDDGAQPLVRSPDAPLSDVFATGTSPRTFTLPGGGRLSLDADTTVEVLEAADGRLTLRLLRGNASVDASELPIAIVSGQAQVTAPAGSSVLLRRSDTDVAVSVSAGSVEVTSPSGERHTLGLGDGQTRVPVADLSKHDTIARPIDPTPVAIAHRDERRAPSPSPTDLIDPSPLVADAAPPAPAVLTSWLAKYQKESKDSQQPIPAVSDDELTAAISKAQGSQDLMDLSDIASATNRNGLAVRALRRVADEFAGDPNRAAAAVMLSRFYTGAGNAELATRYADIAKQAKAFGEIVLCREVTTLAADDARHDEAVRKAEEYLSKYPDAACAADARAVLDDAKGDAKPDDSKQPDSKQPDSKQPDAKQPDAGPSGGSTSGAPGTPPASAAPTPSGSATPPPTGGSKPGVAPPPGPSQPPAGPSGGPSNKPAAAGAPAR
jgi:ferric-dicitrate binding protein FerR (iron transport regulator)